MPGRPRGGRLVPRVDLTVRHLYHLVRGRTFFGDRRGGFGGVWPHIPFVEAAARAAWQPLCPVFLPWWQARYPALIPWAEAAFVTGEPGRLVLAVGLRPGGSYAGRAAPLSGGVRGGRMIVAATGTSQGVARQGVVWTGR